MSNANFVCIRRDAWHHGLTFCVVRRHSQGDGGYDSQWQNRPEALAYCAQHPLPSNATEAASIIIGGIDLEGI